MWHRSNYDWILFLTSPMAFTGVPTHDFVFTRQTLKLLDHGCSLYCLWPGITWVAYIDYKQLTLFLIKGKNVVSRDQQRRLVEAENVKTWVAVTQPYSIIWSTCYTLKPSNVLRRELGWHLRRVSPDEVKLSVEWSSTGNKEGTGNDVYI